MASARKYGPGWSGPRLVSLIKDWIARCEVSGRLTSSRKYGLGQSGPGYGQFDKGIPVLKNMVLDGLG